MKNRIPFIEQMEHSECGLACVAMVLNYYKHHISLTELRDEFGLPKGGASFYHLAMIGREKGMETRGIKSDIETLRQLPLPLILHWNNRHFVVLWKIKKNMFYIVDPEYGRKKVSLEEFSQSYSGMALFLEPTDTFQIKKRESDIGLLFSFIKEQKKIVVFLILLSLFLQVSAIAIPLLTKWVTDNVLLVNQKPLLSMMGYAVCSIFLLNLILSLIRGIVITKLQTSMDSHMMSMFIKKLFKLPFKFFENRSSGELLFRSNLNNYIRQILSTNSISFFIDIMLVITYLIIMFNYSSFLALIVLMTGIVLMSIVIFNTRVLKTLSDRTVSAQGEVQKYLSEHIYGISDVKMIGHEDAIYQNWKNKYQNQLNAVEKSGIWTSSIQAFSNSIHFVLPLFLLWVGGYLVLNNEITLGTLVAFNSMAVAFITPLLSISSSYTDFISLTSYIQRLMDVIKSKPEQEETNTYIKRDIQGNITLKNISFSYDSFSEPVLKNITLTIRQGEKIAIVGPSGSGKSTLAKIILGLYQPTAGAILYDEFDIKKYDLKFLRSQIGAVLQEARLFNQSIFENIVMGKEEHIPNFETAMQQSNTYKFIESLPLGIYTKISEGGANFSGGQRQRLILARALISNPKILVLDEATSALDNISERLIDESISQLSCTRVVIAHRLSTIKNADKIIVLENGEISEVGTHAELLDKAGMYQRLYMTEHKINVKS